MVFGLSRKGEESNFQSFEDSGFCSFDGDNSRFALLGSGVGSNTLLGDKATGDTSDNDSNADSLAENSTHKNLHREHSLVEETQQERNTTTPQTKVRNKSVLLRAPSMDRDSDYLGKSEGGEDCDSVESNENSRSDTRTTPMQFQIPTIAKEVENVSNANSLKCLDAIRSNESKSLAYNASMAFTTCFDDDQDSDEDIDEDEKVAENVDATTKIDALSVVSDVGSVTIEELLANRIIASESAKRIKEYILQKKQKNVGTTPSNKDKDISELCELNIGQGSTLAPSAKIKSAFRNESTHNPLLHGDQKKTDEDDKETSSGSHRKGSSKSRNHHTSPDRQSKPSNSHRGSNENRKADHSTPERRITKDSSNPSMKSSKNSMSENGTSRDDFISESNVNDLIVQNDCLSPTNLSSTNNNDISLKGRDDKSKKYILGSPGKMMMKLLSQRYIPQEIERLKVEKAKSQRDLVSPRKNIDIQDTSSHSLGISRQDIELSGLTPKSEPNAASRKLKDIKRKEAHKDENNFEKELGFIAQVLDTSENVEIISCGPKPGDKFDDRRYLNPDLTNEFTKSESAGLRSTSKSESVNKHKARKIIARTGSLEMLSSPSKVMDDEEIQNTDDNKAVSDDNVDNASSRKTSKLNRERSASRGSKVQENKDMINKIETSDDKLLSSTRHGSKSPSLRKSGTTIVVLNNANRDISVSHHVKSHNAKNATEEVCEKGRQKSDSNIQEFEYVRQPIVSGKNFEDDSPNKHSSMRRASMNGAIAPESPSKRRNSISNRGLSQSVHFSPSKRRSSTAVSRRLQVLASAPLVTPDIPAENDLLMISTEYQLEMPEPSITNKVVTNKPKTARRMSGSHTSPSKRVGSSNSNESRKPITEPLSQEKITIASTLSSSVEIALKNNGSHATAVPTRARKATVGDLKKDFVQPEIEDVLETAEVGQDTLEECSGWNPRKSVARTINKLKSKKVP